MKNLIIHACDKDRYYAVCKQSKSHPHIYRTLAECTSLGAAELCFNALENTDENNRI